MVFYDSKGNIIQVQSNGTLANLDIDETNQGSIEHVDLMKDDYIELDFNIKDPVYFPIGSYCKYNEKLYYVLDKQTPSVTNTGLEYKLKLEAYYMKWKHILFMYNKSNGGEAGWSLTGDINMFGNVLVHVLTDEGLVYNGKAFSFVVDSTVTPDINTVDFSSVSVIEALNLIAEKFECEWWIIDNIIHFGKCELGGDYTKLEVGEEIASCSCSSSSDSFANRIYAFGSDRNIPSTYRKHLQFNSDTIGTENGKTTISDSTRPIKSTYFSGISDTTDSVPAKITFLTGNYKGKTYNATVNPDKAVNGGVIMLDASITPSMTDTYSVEGLLPSQVPVSYYTADNDYVKNSVVQNRLALPIEKPYVDIDDITDKSNLNIDESDDVVPAIVTFDKEYPKLTSTIQSVSVEMIHYKDSDGNVLEEKYPQYTIVLDKPTDFDKKYIIKDSLKCAFQSGLLAGSEYELQFNSGSSFTIVNNSDYGRQLPDTVLVPKVGDTLILYNYDTEYFYSQTLSDAEQHLKQTAITYLAKKLVDPSTYSCKMNVMQDNDLELGEKVNLIAPEYIKSKIVDGVVCGRKSRIVGYEKALDGSSCTYTVGESTAYSRLNTLESKVDSIEYNGASYQYTGSGNGISLYLITSNDSTIPSDSNAFSAKRSRKEFLSKIGDERTEHSLSIGKNLTVDGEVKSTKYDQGNTGYVIRTDADGKTYAEVDKLYVRLKAVFDTLEIRKFQGSTGNRIVSNATAIITRIEVVKDVSGNISGYRCFFKGTDGDKTISNDFIIGDFAFCKESNAKGIHYYWRKITDINVSPNTNNELSILLSASDCDTDSDVPQVQDNIIQLGSLDTTRQGAIIEYTSGEDSPSYKIYQNINSYSLADKDVLGLGYNSGSNKAYMNVYGDAYIGDKNGGDFVKYDPEKKKITIKGELLVTADKTLTQLLDQYSTSDAMEKAISNAQTSAEKNANDYSDKALNSAQKVLLQKISDLGKSLGNYSYLLDALKQDTSVEGGLLQTSLLSLGYTDSEGARHTMAGTNGIPTAGSEGQSIAAWYGGGMVDRQQYDATKTSHYNDKATIDDNAAKTLFRMDGSGYTAKGNLTWDERGILTIKQVTWGNEDIKNFFNAFSVGLLNDKLQITPKGDFTTLTVNGEKVLTLNTLMEDTTYWGVTMISGKVTGDINIGGKLYIGYDTTNDAVVFYKSTDGGETKEAANVYSLGGLSAFGANTNISSSGGSGTSYDRLDKWSDYTVDRATDVLSALLGNDLNERLKKVEAGALTAVDWSIITSIPTINGTSLKGNSVVTAKWGTERMLTIGQTAKSVDGSENVAWSLVEIGAAAASHTHVWKDITDHPTLLSQFTDNIVSGHYLPLSGGLMSGTAIIQFADDGAWANSNSGITFPVRRGGLYWTGESDWVKLFAEETGADNLDLVLQFGDDNSNKLQIRNASGSQTAYITASGVFGGSLSGNASSASKVNNTLSWSGYSSGSFDGSTAKSISIPNNTNQLANGAGFITSAASISGNAAKLDIPIATSIDHSDNSFYVCYAAGSNSVTTKPAGVDGFGLIGLRVAAGWYGQILMADSYDMFYRNGNGISSSTAWKRLLDSGNYSSFALPLHGTADTSTKFASAQVISLTGDITGSASSQAGWNIATSIGAGKVTNSMLAGGIDNSKLAHSTITIAGITIALGGSVAADSITSAASKLGLVTKGSANQAIYLNAGIPTVCSYTFGNGNGNVPVSNGTVNSNLNADMLDGCHLNYIINQVGNTDFSDFPNGYIITSSTDATNNPYSIVGGNQATILQVIPGNNTWGAQLAIGFGNARLAYRTHANSSTWTSWTNIIAGNADQAVKLQTARALWGQSFDGTGNVDGCINVNSKTSDTNYNQNIRLHPGNGWTTLMFCGPENTGTAGTSANSWSLHTNNGQFMLGHNSTSNVMLIDTNNNIGIGTTSPAYKLDVNGTLHTAGATTLGSTLDIAGLTHIGGTLELYNLLTFNLAEGHFGTSYGYTDPWSGLGASFKFGGSVAMVAAYVNGLVHAAGAVTLDSTLNVKGVSAFGNYISMGSNRINFGTLNSTGWGYAFYADDSGMNIDCTSESLKTLGIYADTVTVNGNFLSTGGVTAYTSSDRRLKMNIQPVNSLAVIRTLGGTYQFDWRKDGRHSIGFIAQNVEQSKLLSMVYHGKDGYLKLNYLDTRLISLALGASIQLDDEVAGLKRKVAGLEKEVELLKKAS
jgi:hypothetical protein